VGYLVRKKQRANVVGTYRLDIDFYLFIFCYYYIRRNIFFKTKIQNKYILTFLLKLYSLFYYILNVSFFEYFFLGTMELKLRATINTTLSTSPTHQSTTGKRNAFDDVVVSEDAEFIPIGTGGATATDVFTLDVTLAGVDQLKGIATTISGPYYLTYGMFGVVTETDTFDSLSHPIFHPIVDSFRVQR
tara:strand:+ start:585 stop:1148 length:564 start_codon:yes stop_codon:yes gene_type:complete